MEIESFTNKQPCDQEPTKLQIPRPKRDNITKYIMTYYKGTYGDRNIFKIWYFNNYQKTKKGIDILAGSPLEVYSLNADAIGNIDNNIWVLERDEDKLKSDHWFLNNSSYTWYNCSDKRLRELFSGRTEDNDYFTTGNLLEWFNKYSPKPIVPECQEPPQPPTPGGGDGQNSGGQTDNASCSNTGQFGGGGKPLKDIKLFLYANNVTKGTIKLSKPQVEVGTFATDWRPNPSDYVERNSPAYKEIKGLAIQHNQAQNKKYIEVQATDGTVYGVDLWGGDAKKLLEQQQAEIEELKKMVQTLETKINV